MYLEYGLPHALRVRLAIFSGRLAIKNSPWHPYCFNRRGRLDRELLVLVHLLVGDSLPSSLTRLAANLSRMIAVPQQLDRHRRS